MSESYIENFNTRINNSDLKQVALKEEQRLLSICLRHKDKIADALSFGIKSGNDGHFWNKEPRTLWTLIVTYFDKYKTILTKTAIESLTETIQVEGQKLSDENRISLRLYWDKIYNLESSVEDFDLLINNINNRYAQWQASTILREGLEGILKSESNQNDLIEKIKAKFSELSFGKSENYDQIFAIQDGMKEAFDYVKDRKNNPEKIVTVPTYIKSIDDMLNGGLEKGSYTVVSGMINGGKSTLMMNVGFNMAKNDHVVIYASIEKKAIPIYVRLLALYALVDYNRIKRGGSGEKGIDERTFDLLDAAYNDIAVNLKDKFYVIQVAQGVKLTKILTMADKIKETAKKEKNREVDAFIVDYLGVISPETTTVGRPDLDEYKISQRLQGYGRRNNYVTITGSQLKTQSSKDIRSKVKKISDTDTKGFEINSEDYAGSKGIIADADNAWGVALNQDYPPTKMFVFFSKARDDQSRKTVCLDFDGNLGRVSDSSELSFLDTDSIVYDKKITIDKIEEKEDMALFSTNAFDKITHDNKVKLSENLNLNYENKIVENSIVEPEMSELEMKAQENKIIDSLFDDI